MWALTQGVFRNDFPPETLLSVSNLLGSTVGNAQLLSRVQLFATPWTPEYRSGSPFPSPDFPDPGSNLGLLCLLYYRLFIC